MGELTVLEAITPSSIGGAEVTVANLCALLPALGVRVELFCPAGRRFVQYAAQRHLHPITWRTHGKLDPVTLVRLARLIRDHRVDVIHTHLSTAGVLGALAARRAGKPSVAHVHGLNPAAWLRFSTAVIAVSEAAKRHLCAQGLAEHRVRVIHNGVDLTRFAPVAKAAAKLRLGYDTESPLLGVFGRLSREKGQSLALEAMSRLIRSRPAARLALVGQGKDRQRLEEAARRLGIAQNVELAGFLPDVRAFMSACDVVVVPSPKEAFGLAAVEAMALERPVVASAVGGLPEIVVHGETGLLVASGDCQAMAESIECLIADSSLAERMGKRGRERVRDCFELEEQTRQILSVLREVA